MAGGECTLLGDGRWSLESALADSHVWEFLLLCAGALLGCSPKRMGIILWGTSSPFSFQRGAAPAFRRDNTSTYCLGRIQAVIRHGCLFLTLVEAHKAGRSSDLTHSFCQLFLLLSYLIAETGVSAMSSVTCFISSKMQEVSWWTGGSALEKSSSLGWQVWIWLRDSYIPRVSFRECSYTGL